MKRSGIVVVFAMLSANAIASDWQSVASSSNSNEFYLMDFASIASSGNYKKAWIQTNYIAAHDADAFTTKKYGSERALYYFDCAARTLGSFQYVRYEKMNSEGEVVGSYNQKFSPGMLLDVVPDSVGETFLNTACGKQAERDKIKQANKVARDVFLKAVSDSGNAQQKQ